MPPIRAVQNRPSDFTRLITGICMALCLLSCVPRALAHAVLQKSSPAIDASVHPGAVPVLLTFNSRIDAGHSSLSLLLPDGKPVSLAIDTTAAANVVRSQTSPLAPGKYALRWQVMATDGHITRGEVPFVVK